MVLFYVWSKIKGDDQLCSCCTADLWLCADCWFSDEAAQMVYLARLHVFVNYTTIFEKRHV